MCNDLVKKKVKLFVIIMLFSLAITACDGDSVTKHVETVTLEKENLNLQNETETKNAFYNVSHLYEFEGNPLYIEDENTFLVKRLISKKVLMNQVIYANDLVTDSDVENASEICRGEIVFQIMKAMNLDTKCLDEYLDSKGKISIPYEKNFYFVNDSGKEYYFEYTGLKNEFNCYVFDVYTPEPEQL